MKNLSYDIRAFVEFTTEEVDHLLQLWSNSGSDAQSPFLVGVRKLRDDVRNKGEDPLGFAWVLVQRDVDILCDLLKRQDAMTSLVEEMHHLLKEMRQKKHEVNKRTS
jgi:hypothetical protein